MLHVSVECNFSRSTVRIMKPIKKLLIKFMSRFGVLKDFIVWLASVLPLPKVLNLMKAIHLIVITNDEMKAIISAVREKAFCRFLIFGLGNDSLFWSKLNRRGLTVFVEDSPAWLTGVTDKYPHIKAFLVDYETKRTQWETLLESPDTLNMVLPGSISDRAWDVILVDGPEGYDDSTPGRMKSIFVASRLAARRGHIFVHDCDRKIEQVYADRFLGKDNLVAEIGLLRHYRIPDKEA